MWPMFQRVACSGISLHGGIFQQALHDRQAVAEDAGEGGTAWSGSLCPTCNFVSQKGRGGAGMLGRDWEAGTLTQGALTRMTWPLMGVMLASGTSSLDPRPEQLTMTS